MPHSKMMDAAKGAYHRSEQSLRRLLGTISPWLLLEYIHLRRKHGFLRLKHPKTFDEKILWLMMYWRHAQKTRCADKYAVRSYVSDNGLGHILPGLFGVYSNSREIDFAKLPDRFVLKCTHGCKFNIVCPDKLRLDTERARKDLNRWLKKDYGKFWGEIHYSGIEPRIICEGLLMDPAGGTPIDYKIYCFNGRASCTMVCTGRESGAAKFAFFDRGWNRIPDFCRPEVETSGTLPRPGPYDVMIDAAERLAKPFPFVRVDLYCLEDRVTFGEMTFSPSGGIDQDLTEAAQTAFGNALRLPAAYRPS